MSEGNSELTGQTPNSGEATSETKSEQTVEKLDNQVKISAKFLARLNTINEGLTVDPKSGVIRFNQNSQDDTPLELSLYQNNYNDLRTRFSERTSKYLQQLVNVRGVKDVQEVEGFVVITYDSSEGMPDYGGVFLSAANPSRGYAEQTSDYYLGLVVVDMNPDKRKDGVTSTTTAVHEMNHQARAVSDYLQTQDPELDMQSAYLKGRPEALFGSREDGMTTRQAYEYDGSKYTLLLGRPFDFAADFENIEEQKYYLDELHPSFLQRKQNWFSVNHDVNTNFSEGKHWEVVGSNPSDRKAAYDLLGFTQGFYTCDVIQKKWKVGIEQHPELFGPLSRQFVERFPDIYTEVGALIGASRTVSQARRLVEEKWKEIAAQYPRLLATEDFQGMISYWGQTPDGRKGAGVENLADLLGVKAQN